MATSTTAKENIKDEYGIERANADEPTLLDKYRQKWSWFDHVFLMNERYGQQGGNQYAAGITYFSVLSMFPLLMLAFAVLATVLARRPDLMSQVQDSIAQSVEGSMADTLNTIIETAVQQRGAMFGIGGLTALWSGLGWMNNLRYGVSKMWKYPVVGGNFVLVKLKDLVALIGLLVALAIALGVTAIGSSGLSMTVLEKIGLDDVPGASVITFFIALVVGLIANFFVFFWMIKTLPRGEVPNSAAIRASIIGAVAFEVFKQLGSMFFSNALSNPAGATFGPIIGIMVLFYFIWRIVLYCSAWAATTPEAFAVAHLDAPAPAVIRVREEVKNSSSRSSRFGLGLAGAALVAALISIFK
ncbi:inner membrane protein YhjD [Corynebacterium sp. sy017]|nr:inner membrane protein YhjD [Corynebacterium sp. sy017]QDZ42090.1 inner membrane protein YhjD [Corynebacterium sp. sy039]TSD91977.1 inner membrane protein YhjD [Corynebacterium sp. SY003]